MIEQPDAVRERIAQKDAILEAALMNAAFDGWSQRTLERSAVDAGFERAEVLRLFPRGADELLEWIDAWADRAMLAAVDEGELARLSIRRSVARLVEARLAAMLPFKEGLRRALLARGGPQRAPGALRGLWHTVDRIWEAADPAGTGGISRYTRRATLAAVLVSTSLYWLEDESEDMEATRAFLARRLEDVMRFGSSAASARGFFSRLPRLRPGLSKVVQEAHFQPRGTYREHRVATRSLVLNQPKSRP